MPDVKRTLQFASYVYLGTSPHPPIHRGFITGCWYRQLQPRVRHRPIRSTTVSAESVTASRRIFRIDPSARNHRCEHILSEQTGPPRFCLPLGFSSRPLRGCRTPRRKSDSRCNITPPSISRLSVYYRCALGLLLFRSRHLYSISNRSHKVTKWPLSPLNPLSSGQAGGWFYSFTLAEAFRQNTKSLLSVLPIRFLLAIHSSWITR